MNYTDIVGAKKAREIWYLCRQYTAHEALEMEVVNKVVPLADLRREVTVPCLSGDVLAFSLQHRPPG